jgi:diaminohydroxyphosphoribosylaminopyrimidine deaminase/5-amino-6-(5-phosphoribosylamino)uracil reductase
VAASLLRADLADHVALFTAGLGIGADGTPGLGALGLTHLAQAQRYVVTQAQTLGPDALTLWKRA